MYKNRAKKSYKIYWKSAQKVLILGGILHKIRFLLDYNIGTAVLTPIGFTAKLDSLMCTFNLQSMYVLKLVVATMKRRWCYGGGGCDDDGGEAINNIVHGP